MQRPRQKFNFLLIPFFDNRCIPCTSTATMKYSWEMYINISSIFFFFLYFKRFLQFGCYFTHLFFFFFTYLKSFLKNVLFLQFDPTLYHFIFFLLTFWQLLMRSDWSLLQTVRLFLDLTNWNWVFLSSVLVIFMIFSAIICLVNDILSLLFPWLQIHSLFLCFNLNPFKFLFHCVCD